MKVYILGAGTSCHLGYPLMNDLLDEVERKKNKISGLLQGMTQTRPRAEITSTLKLIRQLAETYGRNLEHLLTAIDLALMSNNKTPLGYNPTELCRMRKIVLEILLLMFEELDKQLPVDDPLQQFCHNKLDEGDTVITFNYDFLLEKGLWEAKLWTPLDGYGFKIQPNPRRADKNLKPTHVRQRSRVLLLKLHSSLKWVCHGTQNLFFVDIDGLGLNPPPHVRDKRWQPYRVPYGKMDLWYELIEPSFIKRFDLEEFGVIWKLAHERLRRAEKVYVIGYSLPDADSSARQLISTSLRLNRRIEKITVVNPDSGAVVRKFKRLLGPRLSGIMHHVQKTFTKWVSEM